MKKEFRKIFCNNDIVTIIFVLGTFFLVLELKHPFYFLSDDNRTLYLPIFVHNFRALLNGELPLFNFHQYLGIPHFSNFLSAVFNPLIYLSIFLSNTIWGHNFWTIDIAVITNIIIGSIGFYYLIKFFTKNRMSSLYGAFIWSLSSFSIFVSTSWWILSGVTAFFPWMVLFGLKLYRNPNIKNLFLLIIFRLFLFYIGHIEYFIYSMIFEFLTVILLALSKVNNNLKTFSIKYLISYFITFCYTLPILLPAWIRTINSAFRNSKLHDKANYFGLTSWFRGLLNPFNISKYSNNFSKEFLSHIGYIPILLIIFCFFYIVLTKRNRKRYVEILILFFLFILTMFWSTGMLSGLIFYIPILNRFRWPFKLLAFSNFYLILISSFGFYLLIKYLKTKTKKIISLSIGLVMILMCLLNFYLLYTNIYISFDINAHKDPIPLNESLSEQLSKGRIFSLGESRPNPYSVSTLGYNYATLLNLNHFAGYEPLVPTKNFQTALYLDFEASYTKKDLPKTYLRSWGVNWYILSKNPKQNELYSHYFNILSADSCLVVFADDPKRTIFLDKHSNPLIYWKQSQTSRNIEYEMHTNFIQINTDNSKAELLVINYLYNDFFTAYLNNDKIITIKESDNGQMIIQVPEGDNEIIIKYSNPYLKYGIYAILIISLIIFVYIAITNLKSSKYKHY